jgi:DNA polymerase I
MSLAVKLNLFQDVIQVSKKFIIIDGNSLIHRAFYALPLLSTAQGQFTNAAYGFTTMLMRLLEEEKPDAITVAFDKGKITFRNAVYQEYKAHRKATPPELREQFPLVHEILTALGIPIYEQEGYEADDIIGSIACRAAAEGYQLLIVTGDRDALQLISSHTTVLLTKRGITDTERFDPAALMEKMEVTPMQIIDLKGLMGDASDNIPGVPGIGEKTALKLIKEFGTVEGVLANIDKISGKKLQENLREHAKLAELSKHLATIDCNMPLDIDWQHCLRCEPDWPNVIELFKRLEFKSLVQRLETTHQGKNPTVSAQILAPHIEEIETEAAIVSFIAEVKQFGQCALLPNLTDARPLRGQVVGMAVAIPGRTIYVSIASKAVWPRWCTALADKAIKKCTHDGKPLLIALRQQGVVFNAFTFDTMVAAYLLEPTRSDYQLADLIARYMGEEAPGAHQEKGKGRVAPSHEEQKNIAGWLASRLFGIRDQLEAQMAQAGLDKLYNEIEHPLIAVLAEMEYNGITVDRDILRRMGQETGEKIEVLTKEICALAGEEFNINSTRQLGHILFDKLGLPVQKKTKTGYSTDAEVLEKLAGTHPVVDKILEFRMLVKLKSTYLDALDGLILAQTGRVHTTFNQTVTATGRLSSSDPNLQNIPIRTEEGRKIRHIFIPSQPGWRIVSADYSQIELRILAHISQDPNLIDAFRQGQDIHTRTASLIFGVPMDEVTSYMRSGAKAVNFGIVYGISDFGLSRNIGISRQEAGDFIDNYFTKYPKVRAFMDDIVAEAREQGYVMTLLHRRRYLPDIRNSNFNLRSFAERTAMNTPIQGSAADVIKKAMVDIYRTMCERQFAAKLLLQVHDELVFEVPPHELDEIVHLVKLHMEQAVQLSIPLTVDVKIGNSWGATEKV